MTNPYATPKADLIIKSSSSGDINSLPSVPTFTTIILSLATLGMYDLYWMYTRSKLLNEISDSKKISRRFVAVILTLEIITYPFTVYYWVTFLSKMEVSKAIQVPIDELDSIVTILTYSCLILTLFWAFIFRRVFHEVLKIEYGNPLWGNAGLVILFEMYYLNFKINQAQAMRGPKIIQ